MKNVKIMHNMHKVTLGLNWQKNALPQIRSLQQGALLLTWININFNFRMDK